MATASARVALAVLFAMSSAASAVDYYVAPHGSDGNPGTEAEPWKTIQKAADALAAGDTAYIKAGTYNESVVVRNSGIPGSCITFAAYPGEAKRPIELQVAGGRALLDGTDQTGTAILLRGQSHVVLRGFDMANYARGIRAQSCSHITIEDLTFRHMGTDKPWCGQGISCAVCQDCAIRDCRFHNCNIHGIYLHRGTNAVIEGCYLEVATGTPLSADYGIYTEHSERNTIRDCEIRNIHPLTKGHHGHGIALRLKSHHNRVLDCESHGMLEHFVVGEDGYENEFLRCVARDAGAYRELDLYTNGLVSRMGAHDNRFIQCRSVGVRQGLSMWGEGKKTEWVSDPVQRHNVYRNCVVSGAEFGMVFLQAAENVVHNCVLANCKFGIAVFTKEIGGNNAIRDSILTRTDKLVHGDVSKVDISYCSFWDNGFGDLPQGEGNISEDPLFADPEGGNYRLKSEAGRWDPATEGWVRDEVTSPCIDAGHPESGFANEPEPNGGRANMGAYGNTAEASKSTGRDAP